MLGKNDLFRNIFSLYSATTSTEGTADVIANVAKLKLT